MLKVLLKGERLFGEAEASVRVFDNSKQCRHETWGEQKKHHVEQNELHAEAKKICSRHQ